MTKIIRFANEGFKNYKQTIKENDKEITIEGCYVFINKVIKMALKYDRAIKNQCAELGVRNRNEDIKNIGNISDESYVYARNINFDGLYIAEDKNGIFVQPESSGNNIDTENFIRVKVRDLVENLKKYETLEKSLRKKAKEKGVRLGYFNSPYIYYEAIVNVKDIDV